MQELIEDFMAQKRFAVVGASDNPEKYGNRIVKNLKARGYAVYPVNPRLAEIEGLKCYPSLAAIPDKIDVVDFVVPPQTTEAVLKECVLLGLDRIWMQPGSESPAAVRFCQAHNLKVVHDTCVMMH